MQADRIVTTTRKAAIVIVAAQTIDQCREIDHYWPKRRDLPV